MLSQKMYESWQTLIRKFRPASFDYIGVHGAEVAVSSAAPMPLTRSDALCLAGVIAWTVLVLGVTTGGYNSGDDIYYLDGVDGWLHGVPFVGTLHWHMRHFLILALSISITLLGRTEAALMAPGIVSFVVVVLVLYFI